MAPGAGIWEFRVPGPATLVSLTSFEHIWEHRFVPVQFSAGHSRENAHCHHHPFVGVGEEPSSGHRGPRKLGGRGGDHRTGLQPASRFTTERARHGTEDKRMPLACTSHLTALPASGEKRGRTEGASARHGCVPACHPLKAGPPKPYPGHPEPALPRQDTTVSLPLQEPAPLTSSTLKVSERNPGDLSPESQHHDLEHQSHLGLDKNAQSPAPPQTHVSGSRAWVGASLQTPRRETLTLALLPPPVTSPSLWTDLDLRPWDPNACKSQLLFSHLCPRGVSVSASFSLGGRKASSGLYAIVCSGLSPH